MASDTAHPTGSRIMDYAAQHLALLVVLRRSDTRRPGGGRQEARVIHAQWRKNLCVRVFVQCFSGDLFDQEAKSLKIDVAVQEARAGRIDWPRLHGHGECGISALPRGIQIQIRSETGEMGQQLADSDVFFAILPELGQVGRDRIVESHSTF